MPRMREATPRLRNFVLHQTLLFANHLAGVLPISCVVCTSSGASAEVGSMYDSRMIAAQVMNLSLTLE